MSQPSDWRDASAYDYVVDLNPSQLAWEFLRRNTSYQDDFQRLGTSANTQEVSAFLDKWGLCFRGRPDAWS
ncbi:DUF6499 domain-containing protein [Devosia sp.]